MTVFRKIPLALAATLAFSVQAQNLVELIDAAKKYDATYLSARSQYEANLARADQALSYILPNASLVLTANRQELDYTAQIIPPSANSAGQPISGYQRWYINQSAQINLTQPLYRPANLLAYDQSKKQISQALTQLVTAEQDLLVRVSQAYFDVLASQDSLAFIRAQKSAVAEQLASAKRNFEVGTATITDTREAEARYDLARAQEIAAENDLRVKRLILDQSVGMVNIKPKPLAKEVPMPVVLPADQETWVQAAQGIHPALLNAQLNLDIAKMEIDRARAGHKPTVDLQLGYSGARNVNGTATSGAIPYTNHVVSPNAAVVMTVPLFSGFSVDNRIRETVYLEEKARTDLEGTERNVAQATRTAYMNVESGLGQIKALEAAERSSQVALEANNLGYKVGVRINIDVLNSQSQLYQTKRDLSKARYDLLVGVLKLRQANGSLKYEDLQQINSMLDAQAK
jgi:outer membrane protein